MKFFVTGRSNNYQKVIDAFDEIERKGHEVTLRWTDFPMIKPYEDNPVKAGEFSVQQMKGVADADVYIIYAHEDGNGVFSELGAALVLAQLNSKPKIYAIGDEEVKAKAMFHYHPAIEWFESLEQVFDRVGV